MLMRELLDDMPLYPNIAYISADISVNTNCMIASGYHRTNKHKLHCNADSAMLFLYL